MAEARDGDKVRVHYTGKLGDGTIFDSSREREPMDFQIGEGNLISGFEDAVVGMAPGESKTVEIANEDAYGAYRDDLVLAIQRDQIPADLDIKVGQQLRMQQPEGETLIVTVVEIGDSEVTLDANHPLAGQDLSFEIELLEIL